MYLEPGKSLKDAGISRHLSIGTFDGFMPLSKLQYLSVAVRRGAADACGITQQV